MIDWEDKDGFPFVAKRAGKEVGRIEHFGHMAYCAVWRDSKGRVIRARAHFLMTAVLRIALFARLPL